MLKEQICNNLDLLIGSVVRSPAMMYHSLTTKVEGKTVTRYVRKGLVPKVKKMTDRNKRVRRTPVPRRKDPAPPADRHCRAKRDWVRL